MKVKKLFGVAEKQTRIGLAVFMPEYLCAA